MKIKEFAQKVQDAVKDALGEGYQVSLQEVAKNNNVILQGLVILAGNQNLSPTIYLNSFWEAYEEGAPLSAVVGRILEIYREDAPKTSIDMEFFKDFDSVKDRICYRLIHREKNSGLLAGIPHIEFLDMAVCFHYAYKGDELGNGTILVHNNHMDMWGTSTAGLLALAQENSPRLFPWECRSMEDILCELMKKGQQDAAGDAAWEEQEGEAHMQVLSNKTHTYGAACILYPGLLERLAKNTGGSLYILPSSVHEVILLADDGKENEGLLKEMIADVNSTQVAPEEVLSDSLYYYDHIHKNVKII